MTALATDTALWQACQTGDREAFATLVGRYQSLVASVAYSRTGNLAASQDLAQETFVIAWRQLPQLRDPLLLRSWLCGIVRNLTASAQRSEQRRGGPTVALDAIVEPETKEVDPETRAVTREEEALLWRALEGLPESVREPLVLFYREEQSVSEVAAKLDLSEPAVRQRLSRGRTMLREELAATGESVLTRSRPNAAFTAAVMAAIGVAAPIPAMAAGVGAGVAASKGAAGGLGAGVVAGPAAGFATSWLASKAVASSARSEEERALVSRAFRSAWLFTGVAVALLLAVIFGAGESLRQSPWLLVIVTTGWTAVLLTYLIRLGARMSREIRAVRISTGTADDPFAPASRTHFVSRTRLLGLPVFAYGSSGLDAGAETSRMVRGWVAIGDFAVSPLLAIGGLAIAPVAIGGITIGALSLSIAGLAAGVLAVGSISVGWWAFGGAAVGWQAAAGGVAIAHDYAIGGIVRAAEANTVAASTWFSGQWFKVPVALFASATPLLIALAIVVPLTLLFRKSRRRRAAMARR
jgi:RNA polymerase sigma factor (sigma-70 family)